MRYGNYWHQAGEVSVTIDKRVTETDAGIPYETTHTWTVRGQVIADTTAAVVAALGGLERAYGRWFQSAALVADDGTVCHQLPNAGSTSGVRVLQPPSYPDGSGAQLSTFRDYTIVLEAVYPAAGQGALLRSWTETIAFSGGLPDRRLVTTANGLPVPYVVSRFTPFRAVQTGQAVGLYAYPPAPIPLWPTSLEGPDHPVTYGSPQTRQGRLVDWPVSWAFRFAAVAPLVGRPRAFPTG